MKEKIETLILKYEKEYKTLWNMKKEIEKISRSSYDGLDVRLNMFEIMISDLKNLIK